MALIWLVKQWHKCVLREGRVVVRIRGHRYLFDATRVDDPTLVASLESKIDGEMQKLRGKRHGRRGEHDGEIWLFRLEPR